MLFLSVACMQKILRTACLSILLAWTSSLHFSLEAIYAPALTVDTNQGITNAVLMPTNIPVIKNDAPNMPAIGASLLGTDL